MSLITKKNILVTGANRGIGLGLVAYLLASGNELVATWRNFSKSSDLQSLKSKYTNTLSVIEIDFLNANAALEISEHLKDQPIDIFINNAAVMGPIPQTIETVSPKLWSEVLNLNLVTPLLITQKILKNIRNGKDKKLFFMSSKVGSITDNSRGGMYIQRSSKTALNQVVKSLSIDLSSEGILAIALHPGWVKTRMGGENALITVEKSVSGMVAIMAKANKYDTGKFFNYDGTSIPW